MYYWKLLTLSVCPSCPQMRKLPLPPFFVKSDNFLLCFSESQNTAGLKSGSTPLFCWITPDMMLIFGLVLLLETAACVVLNCSFDQSVPCSAALGDELRLKLADTSKNNLKIHKIIYNTPDDPVCKIKNDRIKKEECDLFENRPVSVNNGILVINSVIRADSGNYRLEVFDSQGAERSRDLQVIVEGNDPATIAIVLGCLAVVLILLVIVAYYFYKKKNQLKPTRNHVNEHDAQKREEEQKRPDVEYATVNSQNKRKMKMKEEEIHYGEVTFISSSVQRPRQTHEDCVYSEVHTR